MFFGQCHGCQGGLGGDLQLTNHDLGRPNDVLCLADTCLIQKIIGATHNNNSVFTFKYKQILG